MQTVNMKGHPEFELSNYPERNPDRKCNKQGIGDVQSLRMSI
jgi:hypothetical protein